MTKQFLLICMFTKVKIVPVIPDIIFKWIIWYFYLFQITMPMMETSCRRCNYTLHQTLPNNNEEHLWPEKFIRPSESLSLVTSIDQVLITKQLEIKHYLWKSRYLGKRSAVSWKVRHFEEKQATNEWKLRHFGKKRAAKWNLNFSFGCFYNSVKNY